MEVTGNMIKIMFSLLFVLVICNVYGSTEGILFVTDKNGCQDIASYSIENQETVILTNSDCNNTNPFYAKALNKVIFSSDRDGNYEIYSINMDGTDLKRLTFTEEDDLQPVVSACGSHVLFIRKKTLNKGKIYHGKLSDVIENIKLFNFKTESQIFSETIFGKKVIHKTVDKNQFMQSYNLKDVYYPSFVNDDKGILFTNYNLNPVICLFDQQEKKITTITPLEAFFGRANNDCSKCVFSVSTTRWGFDIVLLDSDKKVKVIAEHPAMDNYPCFSPDGSKIVFCSRRVDGDKYIEGDFELYIYSEEGLHQITHNDCDDIFPFWFRTDEQIR